MLEQLRRVTQAVNLAEGKQKTLDVIVSEVCDALSVEVCSVYIADYELNQFVLMANRGLNPECIGHTRLEFNQGLVGLIGQREEPLHLQQASQHPSYSYLPETEEDDFNAFLGVPIIHQRKVLGVLVIQQKAPRQFEIDEETFLITLAAQLSATLSNTEISELFSEQENEPFVRMLKGSPASSGIAIGRARVIFPSEDIHSVPDRKTDNIDEELKRLALAVKATHRQLERMARRMQGKVSEQELSLFEVYQHILSSQGLADEVEAEVRKGYWSATALRIVIQRHLNAFRSMRDPYLRERGNDIEDLANRVLAQLLRVNQNNYQMDAGTVVVAEVVTASLLASLPLDKVVGIISLKGSSTTHAAILAKALDLPAIMGLEGCPLNRMEDKQLIVDGYNGQLYISPNDSLLVQYQHLIKEEEDLAAELAKDQGLPNQTCDGQPISLMINSNMGTDASHTERSGADGIGLFRTEFPFMQLEQFPSETMQTRIYANLMCEFEGLPITIRTLDIGGDKQLSYFPIDEDNPFLGWRGIRVTLDHPEIFLVQLRAIFKASAGHGQVKLALPMVSTLEELSESQRLIHQAFDEVQAELYKDSIYLKQPQIGLVLEVPSTLFQLPSFARRVDFISVGTNDLLQYLMAVDRNNPKVKDLYSHFQPAMLGALQTIADQCQTTDVSLQVCGEMAADPLAAPLLVGMGFHTLSMNVSSLPRVKRALASFDMAEMQQMVCDIKQFETEPKVRDYLLKCMERRGVGGLVRAGR